MKTAKSKSGDVQVGGKRKRVKDPNKPKRPASAFLVFMEGFREEFKQKNPTNKLVSVVSKAGGDKWKSLSEADKAPYVAKAAKRKTEYEKSMVAYNKKLKGECVADEVDVSDKSKSEVEDDDDDAGDD